MRNPSELETGVASTAARDRAVAFTKMHGIGNDFLVIELSNEQSSRQTTIARLQRAAVSLCDRRKGVGADGLLLVDRHVDGADARMVVINADGGVAEMCGNGLRCVCKYFVDRGDLTHMPLRIATGAGVLSVEYTTDVHGNVDQVTVDMGVPRLAARDIPVSINGRDPEHRVLDIPIDTCMQFDDQDWLHAAGVDPRITAVSMGNPHVIIYCDHLDALPVQVVGPQIEHHPTFPERTNVHFVQRLNREQVVMRTWERGSGLTQACGTGACAVCVAGVLTDRTSQRLVAHLPGGTLWLEWPGEQSGVLMTGSAETVFTGSIDLT